VIIKGSDEARDKDIRIINCEESYIYINTYIRQVSFINCKEVTCLVAASSKLCTMDKCDTCTLVISSNLLRIGNSVDCSIHAYVPMPPVLYGDNRGLTLGPLNVFYPDLPAQIERAGIPLAVQNPKCAHNWSSPINMNSEGTSFNLLQPKDFFKLALPQVLNPQEPSPSLTPEQFVNAIRIREEYFANIQNMISRANLTEEQEKRLQMAIQGYFREWLISTGLVKAPTELVRMIDQE
jgi:hypothetical protein